MANVEGVNNTAARNNEQESDMDTSLPSSSLNPATISNNDSIDAIQFPSISGVGRQSPSTSRHDQQTPSTSGLVRQQPSLLGNIPETTNIYTFKLHDQNHIVQTFDELLEYDHLVEKIKESNDYINYGQGLDVIKQDIRSEQSIQDLFLEMNNIGIESVMLEVMPNEREQMIPRATDRQISFSDYEMEEPNSNNTGIKFNQAMSSVDLRKNSYDTPTWSRARENNNFPHNITNEEFANSGFYYLGSGDRVQCYSCGGGLESWASEDTPDNEHARRYPACLFIRDKLSSSAVQLIQQTLTPEARHLLRPTLDHYPNLYADPLIYVASSSRRANQQSNEINDIDLAENHLSTMCTRQQMDLVKQLKRKLQSARMLNNGDYKYILNQLIQKPDLIEEITVIIDTMLERDCQDHTAEVCDQIKIRFKTAALIEDVCDTTTGRLDWAKLLDKSKELFNESALINVMTNFDLISSRESTEIRGYLKNKFVEKNICKFSENHIDQTYDDYARQQVRNYNFLEEAFKQEIVNMEQFKEYFHNMCSKDEKILSFIINKDEELETWMKKEKSIYELLLEDTESSTSETNSQGYIEITGNLMRSRESDISNAINQFINSKIAQLWDFLVLLDNQDYYSS